LRGWRRGKEKEGKRNRMEKQTDFLEFSVVLGERHLAQPYSMPA